jgi:putative spermidine/putrescine transport system ATP-binding protein/spermidine/putrescine transport system ATP-binding protein
VAYDLELIGVEKVYETGTVAVRNFDLQVEKGEFISFVGPSGCGKTTSLRMIAGFESITSGEIQIRGRRINDLPAEQRPTSTIFQNYALFPHMTVRQNVEYGLSVKGLSASDRRKKAEGIMEKLELLEVADRRHEVLSGGQRQRIALARGLAVEPDILLLDEPLGSLDANLRKSIQNELKLLQRNLGITFIVVTHAQSEALVLSDRVIVMNRGEVEQISPPYELYTRPKTGFVAQFIGRNTIIPGTLKGRDGEIAVVDTGYGTLRGFLNDAALSDGGEVVAVVPSEAIDVHSVGADRDELVGRYQGNVMEGLVRAADVVGHTVFYAIELSDGREVNIESHIAKYQDAFEAGSSRVHVTWLPNEATVIGKG